MARFLTAVGLSIALLVYFWPVFRQESIGETEATEVTNQNVDHHWHRHDGPFGHDHVHAGLERSQAHSHPHQHRHQHRSEAALDLAGWLQIGHQHDELQTAFYVKCWKGDQRLHVEFRKSASNGDVEQFHPQNQLNADVYLGTTRLGGARFKVDGRLYAASAPAEMLDHPILTVVFSQVQVDDQPEDFVVPVSISSTETTMVE